MSIIPSFLDKPKFSLNIFNSNVMTNESINIQQLARLCLSPIFDGLTYLPQTNASIDSHSLMILINDVTINNRKSIIEFGSGISTIVIAQLIRTNQLDVKLCSIEDNLSWYNVVKRWIKINNLEDYVRLIYAPLERLPDEEDFTLPWYNMTILEKEFADNIFDMVIVDGPSACHEKIKYSRYPALFFVSDKLATNFSLFLHDSNRFGERTILYNWEKELKVGIRRFTEKLSGFIAGDSFDICFNVKENRGGV